MTKLKFANYLSTASRIATPSYEITICNKLLKLRVCVLRMDRRHHKSNYFLRNTEDSYGYCYLLALSARSNTLQTKFIFSTWHTMNFNSNFFCGWYSYQTFMFPTNTFKNKFSLYGQK